MEGTVCSEGECEEQNNLDKNFQPTEILEDEDEIQKNPEEEAEDEEKLKKRLEELKKENYTLQASISAWQLALSNKLEEFKSADLKLNNIYKEIWLERENFCSKTDEFNKEYGILSEWWEKQMKFLHELENLEEKQTEDEKCQAEMERLEKEINELKKGVSKLQTDELTAEVEVHQTEEGHTSSIRGKKMNPLVRQKSEELEPLESEDELRVCNEEVGPCKTNLFSMVDMAKVRMFNRLKNRRRKSNFLKRVKRLLS